MLLASGAAAQAVAETPAEPPRLQSISLAAVCDAGLAPVSLLSTAEAELLQTAPLSGGCGGPGHQACWSACEQASNACYGSCSTPVCYFHCRQQDVACTHSCDIQYGCF